MSLPTACKFCGAALTWRRVDGEDIPYDAAADKKARPHVLTCPGFDEILDAARRGWDRGVRESNRDR